MDYKVFSKWESQAQITDEGLMNYISLQPRVTMHSQGRQSKKAFGKSSTHIVERLINTLMRSGTGGKLAGRIIRNRSNKPTRIRVCVLTLSINSTDRQNTNQKNPDNQTQY